MSERSVCVAMHATNTFSKLFTFQYILWAFRCRSFSLCEGTFDLPLFRDLQFCSYLSGGCNNSLPSVNNSLLHVKLRNALEKYNRF